MEDEVGMASIAPEFLGRSKESVGTRDNSPTATPCKIKYLVMKCWLTKPQSTRRNIHFVCCSQSFVLCFSVALTSSVLKAHSLRHKPYLLGAYPS